MMNIEPPARHDLKIWIGANSDISFELLQDDDEPFDLSGSELILRIVDGKDKQIMRFSSETGGEIEITDGAAGEFTISLTYAQTRLIPLGRSAQYEIERRIEDVSQENLLSGFIFAEGGRNDD
jgi:hypothetical protein